MNDHSKKVNGQADGQHALTGMVIPVGQPPAFPTGAVPAVLSTTPNAWGLLRAFRRRWFLALCAGLMLAAVAGAAAWAVVPSAKYRARAFVQVSAISPRFLFEVSDTDYARYQRKQLSYLRMRNVLTAALRDSKVRGLAVVQEQEDAVEWLEKNLQASFPNGSEFLQLSMEGDKAQDVAALVNAVLDAYMKEVVVKEHTERVLRLTTLRDTFNKYEEDLKGRRKYLRNLVEDLGSDDKKVNEGRLKLELERLDDQTREQLKVEGDIQRHEGIMGVLKAQLENLAKQEIPDADVAALLASDPVLEPLRKQVLETQAKMTDFLLKHKLKEQDPSYPAIKLQLDALEKALRDQETRIKPRVIEQLRTQLVAKTRADLALKEQELTIWKSHAQTLKEMTEKLQKGLKGLQKGTLDLSQLQREMEQDDQVSKDLGKELAKVMLEIDAPSRITIHERAEEPKTKDETKPLKMAGIAAACGLLAGLLGVCWLEFRARRVDRAEDVVQGLGMRLVGSLPPPPTRWFQRRATLNPRWHKRMAESIDATRTLLVHNARLASLRVLMVTSAVTGEGKTSVSCHLATSLARGGYRTLLVDGDLRRPAVHRLFGMPAGPGFSELLRGEAADRDVCRTTAIPGLFVMPAGNWDPSVTRALTQQGASAAFGRLREHYDFIVVDTSPVLPVVDGLLIGQHADAVLFSVLRDVSCLGSIYTAQQRLAGLGMHILGVVVNGTQEPHRYGYYHTPATQDAGRVSSA